MWQIVDDGGIEQPGEHLWLTEDLLEHDGRSVGAHVAAISARMPSVGAHSHSGRYVEA